MKPFAPTKPARSVALVLALSGTFAGVFAQGIATTASVPATEPSLPYTVKPTDKLIRLTRDMLVRPSAWNEVAKFNQMKDPDLIHPGQKILIPLRLLKFSPSGAKIVSASGDVRLGGVPATVGMDVPEGSRLQTGANSSAVVQLGDGTQVKLLPTTLADVTSNRDYAMRDASASGSTTWFSGLIRLAQGALETLAAKGANRATPLQIETPTSLVGVRGTQFRVAYDDPASKSSRTEVVEGLVRADNPAQASGAELPMGTGAKINPAEKEIRVVKLLPAPDLAGVPAEVLKPLGAWTLPSLAGASSYRVQVASDEKFDKIVRDLKVTGGSIELGSLDIASWYARVRGIDADGIEGFDTVKVVAVREAPRVRVSNASMHTANGKSEMRFEFDTRIAGPFTAVLSRDGKFAAPLRQDTLADGTWDLADLAPGLYYVQFRVKLPGGYPVNSETYVLDVSPNWGQTVFDSTFPLQPAP